MRKHTHTPNIKLTPEEAGWGLIMLFCAYIAFPTLLPLLNSFLQIPLSEAVLNLIYYVLNFILSLLAFHRFLLHSLHTAGVRFGRFVITVILLFAGYLLVSTGLNWIIGLLFPNFSNVNDQALENLARTDFLLLAIGTIFLVPTTEECLMRGLIFGRLRSSNRITAYLVSTGVFCAIHVIGYIGQYDAFTLLICLLQYIPAGLFLAWAYEQTDSIIAPILIHTAVNAMAVGLL